jgi:hypothetical protein
VVAATSTRTSDHVAAAASLPPEGLASAIVLELCLHEFDAARDEAEAADEALAAALSAAQRANERLNQATELLELALRARAKDRP